MYALVENNRVVQLSDFPFDVHPSLSWHEVDETVKENHIYNNGAFSPPVRPTQDYRTLRASQYPQIGDQLDALLKQLNYLRLENQMEMVQELDDIIGQWLAVKQQYPKPEALRSKQ